MRGAVLYGPRDVRFEERPDPTDRRADGRRHPALGDLRVRVGPLAVSRAPAASGPAPMGHEYCGIVEEVGRAVRSIKPGQFVIGSFAASDNTCPHCRAGYQTSCAHREFVTGAQAPCSACRWRTGRWSRREVPSATSPEPAGGVRRARHRLVRSGCGQRQARRDGRGRRRRRGRSARRAVGEADGRRADHRDEPSRGTADARARVRRDRHRDRARRRRRRAHQGTDEGRRRGLGARMRRHAGVDDAGDPLHATGRIDQLRRRAARGRARRARNCSTRTSTCTAARRRCGATCRS